jgi:hypothetical protein
MSYELLEKFTKCVIPDNMPVNPNLPKNKLKALIFARDNNIKNENIDYWMAISPIRQKDELFDEYKERQKFQKALTKYRPFLYQYHSPEELNAQ